MTRVQEIIAMVGIQNANNEAIVWVSLEDFRLMRDAGQLEVHGKKIRCHEANSIMLESLMRQSGSHSWCEL